MRASLLLSPILLSVLIAPGLARGQAEDLETRYSVERFRIASDVGGILDAESGAVLPHLATSFGLWFGYADDPLNVYRDAPLERDRERVASLVSHRLGGTFVAALGLFNRIQLAVDVPLILSQDQDLQDLGGRGTISSFGIGDIRLAPKLQILSAKDSGVDLAIVVAWTLPSAGDEDYFGEAGATFAPELALSRTLTDRLRVAANLGLLLRDRTEVLDLVVDNEVFLHLGAGYRIHKHVELDVTASAATAPSDLFGAFNRNFSELRGGASVGIGSMSIFAALGAGTSEGFGTPDWRALAGLRYAPGLDTAQVTRAGQLDVADNAATAADASPVQVSVAEPASDVVAVSLDESDADGDGMPANADQCPNDAEDVDGFEDLDGCPDRDNDGDGVLDGADQCPDVAGLVGFSGCSRADQDGDGVDDRFDNCPRIRGRQKNFGCLDPQLLRITEGRLEMIEKVHFLTARSTIRPRSYRVLRSVAAVLTAHPELSNVQVEGHTDNRGSERYNQALSERRAEAVKNFIVAAGVEAGRLSSIGRGEAQPVGENTSPEGQAANRRVEFILAGQGANEIRQRDTAPSADTIER